MAQTVLSHFFLEVQLYWLAVCLNNNTSSVNAERKKKTTTTNPTTTTILPPKTNKQTNKSTKQTKNHHRHHQHHLHPYHHHQSRQHGRSPSPPSPALYFAPRVICAQNISSSYRDQPAIMQAREGVFFQADLTIYSISFTDSGVREQSKHGPRKPYSHLIVLPTQQRNLVYI